MSADLERAHLNEANLSGTNLRHAQIKGAILRNIVLANNQHVGPRVADAEWDNTNLAVVDWASVKMLGDEYNACCQKLRDRAKEDKNGQLRRFRTAVRAHRQLAIILQQQELNEDASRFAYRAQLCQRTVLRRQKKVGQYLFSGFLDALAGYGYRPSRSVIWHLVVIFGFALTYFVFGHLPFFPDAFVFSLTSFHGRGFFPGLGSENSLHNPLVIMAAFEAVVGLLIEISFIATFTQRFFGR